MKSANKNQRIKMKIKNIKPIGKRKVYDLSVKDAEHYVLENGVVSHNTGIMYSSDTVLIIGRSQEKDGKDLAGYTFTINIEKSRFVKEKSKFAITVKFDGGIETYSGLMDDAVEGGYVVKPSMGFYTRPFIEGDKKIRAKQALTEDFWKPIFEKTDFKTYLKSKYSLEHVEFEKDAELHENEKIASGEMSDIDVDSVVEKITADASIEIM
jgi:hypothetical protein